MVNPNHEAARRKVYTPDPEGWTQVQKLDDRKNSVKANWRFLQEAETKSAKQGVQFGMELYEYRACAEVVPGGTSFNSLLDELGVPHSSAYRWLAKYEESIGKREKVTKPAPVFEPAVIVAIDAETEANNKAANDPVTILDMTRLNPAEVKEYQAAQKQAGVSKRTEANIRSQAESGVEVRLEEAYAGGLKDGSYDYFEQFKDELQTLGDEFSAMMIEFKLDLQSIKEVLRYAEQAAKRDINQISKAKAA